MWKAFFIAGSCAQEDIRDQGDGYRVSLLFSQSFRFRMYFSTSSNRGILGGGLYNKSSLPLLVGIEYHFSYCPLHKPLLVLLFSIRNY